jgi:hypothetical protein
MRNLLLTFVFVLTTFIGFSQNVLFSENIGTAVSPATILVTSNPFQNSSLTFGGTADTRTTTPSTGYVGASGSRNVFLTPTVGTTFQISSISTINRYNFKLSFGAYKSTNASTMSELVLEYSVDGTKYLPITIPTQPTGTGTSSWRLISNIVLPSSVNNISNLRLRWKQTSSTIQFRIDDIKLTNETALPVELLYFKGNAISTTNHLYWSTASELNSDYFLIEKSFDGIDWDLVGSVNASGNSSQTINYSLTDNDVRFGISYYRLKQFDFDGKFEIYSVISIDNRVKTNVINIVDLMGRIVNQYHKGWVVIYYENGEVIKTYQY